MVCLELDCMLGIKGLMVYFAMLAVSVRDPSDWFRQLLTLYGRHWDHKQC